MERKSIITGDTDINLSDVKANRAQEYMSSINLSGLQSKTKIQVNAPAHIAVETKTIIGHVLNNKNIQGRRTKKYQIIKLCIKYIIKLIKIKIQLYRQYKNTNEPPLKQKINQLCKDIRKLTTI